MAGTSKGIAVTLAGLAFAATAAMAVYYDYANRPSAEVAAYEKYSRERDPLPLAALGDRAQPFVPQLAAILEAAPGRQSSADEALLLGIIGGPQAVDGLIRRLDFLEANQPRDRFRTYSSFPVVMAIAMLDSPRGAERILTYHFVPDVEWLGFHEACRAFETIPDDPDLVLRALQSPKADADRIVVLNFGYARPGTTRRERILGSDALARYLTENHRRFMTSEAPWYGMEADYLRLLDTMTAPSAKAFIESLPEERRPKRRAPAASPAVSSAFASADEIADAYEEAGGTWRIHPPRYIWPETDFTDTARLAAILNADPSPETWVFMTEGANSNDRLLQMGASITPFLIASMEHALEPSSSWPYPSSFHGRQLERFYLLRRATGRNFGLNPEAWRRWWEEEGRAEFEGGR